MPAQFEGDRGMKKVESKRETSSTAGLTHLDKDGKARMVDVSEKGETAREARAYGRISMSQTAYDIVRTGNGPKGDIFTVAKIAGIMAAKKTSEMIPLCHPLALTHVDVIFRFDDRECLCEFESTVKTKGQTGVEMEALICVTVVGLTVYDMCKAIDKAMELGPFYLLEKSGGKSGRFVRREDEKVGG
jgi:cyclic pyranopterin monophosphate synthase